MLKDRRQLENELTKYLVGIDKTKIVNRKLQQQWYTQLSGEYNNTFNMNTLKRWVIMYEDYLHDC